MNQTEQNYIKNYAQEHFMELAEAEMTKAKTIPDLLAQQPQISRQLRMKIIEWLYEVVNKFKIKERYLVFQAVELMDEYIAAKTRPIPAADF